MAVSGSGNPVEIESGDSFVRNEGLEISIAPDGYIVHQTSAVRVHFLNEPAALVFELCDGNHSTADIEAAVAQAFVHLDPRPSPQMVRECLVRLISEGLIARSRPQSSEP